MLFFSSTKFDFGFRCLPDDRCGKTFALRCFPPRRPLLLGPNVHLFCSSSRIRPRGTMSSSPWARPHGSNRSRGRLIYPRGRTFPWEKQNSRPFPISKAADRCRLSWSASVLFPCSSLFLRRFASRTFELEIFATFDLNFLRFWGQFFPLQLL